MAYFYILLVAAGLGAIAWLAGWLFDRAVANALNREEAADAGQPRREQLSAAALGRVRQDMANQIGPRRIGLSGRGR